MTKCDDLLKKARTNPNGVSFAELLKLAKCHKWTLDRQKGSHRIYVKEGDPRIMNFQEATGGKAKPYQVRQLLAAIEDDDDTEGQS
jgi:HicA toxin of bacterial toxin-antitoxin,